MVSYGLDQAYDCLVPADCPFHTTDHDDEGEQMSPDEESIPEPDTTPDVLEAFRENPHVHNKRVDYWYVDSDYRITVELTDDASGSAGVGGDSQGVRSPYLGG